MKKMLEKFIEEGYTWEEAEEYLWAQAEEQRDRERDDAIEENRNAEH